MKVSQWEFIPRKEQKAGSTQYPFHGLGISFLQEELRKRPRGSVVGNDAGELAVRSGIKVSEQSDQAGVPYAPPLQPMLPRSTTRVPDDLCLGYII